MKSFLADLLEYNQYANEEIINSFEVDGFRDEEGIRLFSHLINAHHIWLARMQKTELMFDIWEIHVINSFAEVNRENHQCTFDLLEEIADLEQTVDYTNSRDEAFTNSYRDIFLHIVNHSTYHRAQLARMIRMNGLVPPITDYIFYKREQQ